MIELSVYDVSICISVAGLKEKGKTCYYHCRVKGISKKKRRSRGENRGKTDGRAASSKYMWSIEETICVNVLFCLQKRVSKRTLNRLFCGGRHPF